MNLPAVGQAGHARSRQRVVDRRSTWSASHLLAPRWNCASAWVPYAR